MIKILGYPLLGGSAVVGGGSLLLIVEKNLSLPHNEARVEFGWQQDGTVSSHTAMGRRRNVNGVELLKLPSATDKNVLSYLLHLFCCLNCTAEPKPKFRRVSLYSKTTHHPPTGISQGQRRQF